MPSAFRGSNFVGAGDGEKVGAELGKSLGVLLASKSEVTWTGTSSLHATGALAGHLMTKQALVGVPN